MSSPLTPSQHNSQHNLIHQLVQHTHHLPPTPPTIPSIPSTSTHATIPSQHSNPSQTPNLSISKMPGFNPCPKTQCHPTQTATFRCRQSTHLINNNTQRATLQTSSRMQKSRRVVSGMNISSRASQTKNAACTACTAFQSVQDAQLPRYS